MKIILPKTLRGPGINRFWNQLFFWVTVYASVKLWLEDRKTNPKKKCTITIDGVKHQASRVTITNGHIFLDGEYVEPSRIDNIDLDP